jgi:para-aminobenzoate synthetase component 1
LSNLKLPLYQEIAYQDPLTIFKHLAGQPWAIFLDSANHNTPYAQTNRYSYIAFSPFANLQSHGSDNPLLQLQARLPQYALAKLPSLPPFQGGVAGVFAYDLCHVLDKIPYPQHNDMPFPNMALGFYDTVISFDHHAQQAWVVSCGFPAATEVARKIQAQQRLQQCLQMLDTFASKPSPHKLSSVVCEPQAITANFTQAQYLTQVQRAKDYILAGDIFEVNLAQRFSALLPKGLDTFSLYRRLRQINPAPFAAYVNFGEHVLVSASPERFLKLTDGYVEARPIKGTMARGQTEEADYQQAQALLNSQKDHAENVMIVDLMRNDLSRVCEDDSVVVEKLCGLESFPQVHHLVSVVQGRLQADKQVGDLLQATIPGGSITGAPKIRAMQIIAELEPHRRGPYCGNIGYISFNGEMDTSIVIRSYHCYQGRVTFHAGGAIVLDSDPWQEYQETLTKAHALQRCLLADCL